MKKQIEEFFEHTNFVHGEVFFNDKCLLITKPKLAHSWCRNNFLKNNSKEVLSYTQNDKSTISSTFNSSFEIDFTSLELNILNTDNKNSNFNTESVEYAEEVKTVWNSILSRNEKRDIVVIYRNPLLGWISGFFQDTFSKVDFETEKHSPYFIKFIQQLNIPEQEKNRFIEKCKFSNSYYELIRDDDFNIIMSGILELFLERYIEEVKFKTGHSETWIPFIFKLVNSLDIDTSKIKLLDIYDAPLEIQLKNYLDINPNDIDTNYKRNEKDIMLFMECLMNSQYRNLIQSILKDDYNMYRDLKENYKQYHLNYE